MNQLPVAFQPLSDAGAVQAGSKLYFYRTGTTTAKNTYSDKALSSANANPVVADASGRFGPIYLLKDEGYRVRLTTSADVQVWQKDEVFAPSLAVDEQERRKEIVVSPMDHGAAGDGSTNDATAILAAIAAGNVIDGEGRTYKCNSTLALSSRQRLQNITIDFSDCTSGVYLQVHGSVGTYTALTANASFQATSLSITADQGFAAGDLLAVDAQDAYTDDGTVGEIAKCDSIAGTTITLSAPLLDRYNTASTARVAKITTVDDVTLQNVRLLCSTSASHAAPAAISLGSTRRFTMRDSRITGMKGFGVVIAGCVETTIDNCTFENGDTTSNAIFLNGATQDTIISKCKFSRCDDGVGFGLASAFVAVANGVRRRVTVDRCFFEDMSGTSIGFYRDSQFCKALWNEFNLTGAGAAIDAECVDVDIVGNRLQGSDTGGITVTPIPPVRTSRNYSISISKNELQGATKGISLAPEAISSSAALANVVITENRGANGSLSVSLGTADEDITDLLIANNDFSGGAITLTSSNASATLTHVVIKGNKCSNIAVTGTSGSIADLLLDGNRVGTVPASGAKLVDIDACARVWLSNNQIRGDSSTATTGIEITATTGSVSITGGSVTNLNGGGVGVLIDESPRVSVSGGLYVNSASTALEIDNTSQEFNSCIVSGCTLIAGAGHGLEVDASDATGSTALVVSGNHIETAGGANEYVVLVTGIITGVTLTGNTLKRSNDSDANVRIAGDAASAIDHITAVGNVLFEGDVGLEYANHDDTIAYHSANAFSSVAANDAGAATTVAPIVSS